MSQESICGCYAGTQILLPQNLKTVPIMNGLQIFDKFDKYKFFKIVSFF